MVASFLCGEYKPVVEEICVDTRCEEMQGGTELHQVTEKHYTRVSSKNRRRSVPGTRIDNPTMRSRNRIEG